MYRGLIILTVLLSTFIAVDARCNSNGCCYCNQEGDVVRHGRYGPRCNQRCARYEYCKLSLMAT